MALLQPDSNTATLFDRHRGVVDNGDGVRIEVEQILRFGCGLLLGRLRVSVRAKRAGRFLSPWSPKGSEIWSRSF